jgi:hypothetical protein
VVFNPVPEEHRTFSVSDVEHSDDTVEINKSVAQEKK